MFAYMIHVAPSYHSFTEILFACLKFISQCQYITRCIWCKIQRATMFSTLDWRGLEPIFLGFSHVIWEMEQRGGKTVSFSESRQEGSHARLGEFACPCVPVHRCRHAWWVACFHLAVIYRPGTNLVSSVLTHNALGNPSEAYVQTLKVR